MKSENYITSIPSLEMCDGSRTKSAAKSALALKC